MLMLLDQAKAKLDAKFRPDGYNIGINDGSPGSLPNHKNGPRAIVSSSKTIQTAQALGFSWSFRLRRTCFVLDPRVAGLFYGHPQFLL